MSEQRVHQIVKHLQPANDNAILETTPVASVWDRELSPPKLVPEVEELEQELISDRRHIHQNPELKFEEVKTAEFVAQKLRSLGIEVTENVGITGVVGVLRGGKPGKCIGLRADMDALPQTEDNDLPFKSKIAGKMHTCGHDGHVAMLLTAAKVLAREREHLVGIVKFIFQPGEEGGAGAEKMIKDGALENPKVDEIYGIHLWNYAPVYSVGVSYGPMMASADSFKIEVRGVGGHGAAPHMGRDAVVAASSLVSQLQTIVSRNISPMKSAVVTVGVLNAGTSHNIIADKASLSGTIRSFSAFVRKLTLERIQRICEGIEHMYGCEVILDLDSGEGYPAVVNNSKTHIDQVVQAAKNVVGEDGIFHQKPVMGAEDFSFFLQEVPGCFFLVGSSSERRGPHIHHHSPEYILDERSLAVGASVWCTLVRNLLR